MFEYEYLLLVVVVIIYFYIQQFLKFNAFISIIVHVIIFYVISIGEGLMEDLVNHFLNFLSHSCLLILSMKTIKGKENNSV